MEKARQHSVVRWAAGVLVFCLGLASTAPDAVANPTKSRFADARFETGGLIVMQSGQAEDKLVFLWVYQSKLGQYLNRRAPSSAEVAEMRRLCQAMDRVARQERGRSFDGYGLEFADGQGDTSGLPLSRRVVFFFWAKNGEDTCGQAPSKGRIS